MKRSIRTLLLAPLLFSACFITNLHARDLLIKNARLIDGTGAPPQEGVSILIRNGRIVKIGRGLQAGGAKTLDVKGATVLPGFIDAHVHLGFGAGNTLHSKTWKPWKTTWGRYHRRYLRAYLACGITTVLDAAAPEEVLREVNSTLAAGNPGPRYLALAYIKAPDGYPTLPVFDDNIVSTADGVKTKLDQFQSAGYVGVKALIDKGWSPFSDLKYYSPEVSEAIRLEAPRRGLPVYAHVSSLEDTRLALDLGIRGLMHPIHYRNDDYSAEYIARFVKSKIYMVSTLSVMDSKSARYRPERLKDPMLDLVVPELELKTARSPEAGTHEDRATIDFVMPGLPDFLKDIFAWFALSEKKQVDALRHTQKIILKLHKAGVPIVMGTDSVNNPHAIYIFHGPTSLREIELLGEAGLTPMEALVAATGNPARMLGLEKEIGTVEVGKQADLVVLRDDPLKNLGAVRTIQWTVQNGIAKTPREWMEK